MSENESVAFFIREMVAHARSLPLPEAVVFLRGALVLIGDQDAVTAVSTAYQLLQQSDAQLELIAGPQRKLKLDGPASSSTTPGQGEDGQ